MNAPVTQLDSLRPWFLAAALYNAVWGTAVVLAPAALFDALGIPAPSSLPLWQVVGMMVLVFAPAYWWVWRDPLAHRHFVLVGTGGKVLGLTGFAGAALTGQLPWAFGVVVVFNDLVWMPAFALFLHRAARASGGWRRLVAGA